MRSFSVAAVVVASLLGTARTPADAQLLRGSLDLGSSNVRYADSISVTAATLSPAFQVVGSRAVAGGFGTLSQASGSSTYSGSLFGTVSSSPARRLSGEIGGSAGGSSHSDGARTGQMMGTGRLYLNAERGGGWSGAGIGRTWDGTLWRSVVQGTLGAWVSGALGSAVASLAPTAVDDSIRHTDGMLTLQGPPNRVEVSATLGRRFGDPVPTLVTDRVWGSVSATAWLRPGLGIVASGGTYPIDFTQGYPGGRFLSLALRMTSSRRAAASATEVSVAEPAGDVRAFQVTSGAGGTRTIRVHAPGARTVEITGDFTNWAPVTLAPDGTGWWTVSRAIGDGAHEVNVRANGGAWLVPPGLTPLRDEFGGSTGLLVFP